MTLAPIASEDHVDEALRLFKVSTMQAVLSGHSFEGMARPELIKEIDKIDKIIRQRLPTGSSISYRSLVRELSENKNLPEYAVVKCIDIMVQQEKLLLRNQGKMLIRQP